MAPSRARRSAASANPPVLVTAARASLPPPSRTGVPDPANAPPAPTQETPVSTPRTPAPRTPQATVLTAEQAAKLRADQAQAQAQAADKAQAEAAEQRDALARDKAAADKARANTAPAPTQAPADPHAPAPTVPTPPTTPTAIPTPAPTLAANTPDTAGKSASQRTATLAVTSAAHPGQTVNVHIREHLLNARQAPDVAAIVRTLVATMAGSTGAARSIPVDFRDTLPGSDPTNGAKRHNVGKLALDPDEGLIFTPATGEARRIAPADFRDILAQTAQAQAKSKARVARDVSAVVSEMAAILAEPLWIDSEPQAPEAPVS